MGFGRMSLKRASGLPGAAFMRMTAAARQMAATSVARIARRATVEARRVLTIRGGASATMSPGVLKGASSRNWLVACGVSDELVGGGATSSGRSSFGCRASVDSRAPHLRICWRSCSLRSRSWMPASFLASLDQATRPMTWTGLGRPWSGTKRRATKLQGRAAGVETRRPPPFRRSSSPGVRLSDPHKTSFPCDSGERHPLPRARTRPSHG